VTNVESFHPLAKLRDLSDLDKHRLLPTVVIPATGFSFSDMSVLMLLTMGSAATFMRGQMTIAVQPAELGAVVTRLRVPQQMFPEQAMVGHVTPNIALSEGGTVHEVVTNMTAVVVKLLGEFGPLV
jgi:hypothetical protein